MSGYTTLKSSLVSQSLGGGDANLKIQNLVSGTSSLYFNTNNTISSRLYSDAIGNIIMNTVSTTSTIKFYCGATNGYTISNTGGVGPSDIRFKSEIQNITGALEKVHSIQGKSFYMFNDTSRKQLGYIAQEIQEVIPELIYTDLSDDNEFVFTLRQICSNIKRSYSRVKH